MYVCVLCMNLLYMMNFMCANKDVLSMFCASTRQIYEDISFAQAEKQMQQEMPRKYLKYARITTKAKISND